MGRSGKYKPTGRPRGAPRLDAACKRGHPRNAKSSFIDARGSNVCRLCCALRYHAKRERETPAQKQCRNGHPRTKANTYHRPDGTKECRICMRHRELKYHNKPSQTSTKETNHVTPDRQLHH
ncbi:hypothetical protein SAMN05443248_2993 [Bradyrhizobium erythrophlei]|uniref:Uncharacterized protein n=1 Tax=Bradyrhizobium erythrophlei TaxID=1437360 RepID=A0A1M5NIJ5_9BRAD|nr:hypothetical protein SAMN05443248_2993 [Bradyrhizobium erythrophlei]